MECVKFSGQEHPKDKHDKESEEERRYGLSGPRRSGGTGPVRVMGSFGWMIPLIFNVQRYDLLSRNTAQLTNRELGCFTNLT